MTDEDQKPPQALVSLPISREAAIAAESVIHAFDVAQTAAQQFTKGLALGLGIDPASIVQIDTDHDRIVIEVQEPPQEP